MGNSGGAHGLRSSNLEDTLFPQTHPDGSLTTSAGKKSWFFGSLSWSSSSVVLTLFLLAIFVAQVAVDGLDRLTLYLQFLPIGLGGPFSKSCSFYLPRIVENYELFRWLTSAFVHVHFSHLFGNCITLLAFGAVFECFVISRKKLLFVFLFSAVLVNISLGHLMVGLGHIAVGASGGVTGLVGFQLGYLVLNWYALSSDPRKPIYLVFCIVLIFSSLVNPIEGLSNYPELFGLVIGAYTGMALAKKEFDEDPKFQKRVRVCGWASLAVILAVGTLFTFSAKAW